MRDSTRHTSDRLPDYRDPDGIAVGRSLISWEEANLTPREVDVLRCYLFGESNLSAARTLRLGIQTIKSHGASMRVKTGTHSTLQLVLWALKERGWDLLAVGGEV